MLLRKTELVIPRKKPPNGGFFRGNLSVLRKEIKIATSLLPDKSSSQ